MKIALLIAGIVAIWIAFISFQILNTLPKPRSPAVVTPHCFDLNLRMFPPCTDVDRYEYA